MSDQSSPIAVLADPVRTYDRISRLLSAAGHDLLRCDSLDALGRAASATGAGVIAIPWLDTTLSRPELERFTATYPWYPIVLITEETPENLRYVARTTVTAILFLGRGEVRLPGVVREAVLDGFFRRAAHRVCNANHIPVRLRDAMIYALSQTPATEPVEAGDPAAPARSVREIARRVAISENHLGRLARRSQVERTLGLRPRELTPTGAHTWFRAFEREVLGSPVSPGRRNL